MTRRDVRGERSAAGPDALTLRATPDGGFGAVGPRGFLFEAKAASGGWRVRSVPDAREWSLTPTGEEAAGFALVAEGEARGAEAGRTTRSSGTREFSAPVSLLLGDGRLYRITSHGGGDPGFDLTGWEVPGAYWRARRAEDGWKLVPTAAGKEIAGEIGLLVLFAAEVLLSAGLVNEV